MHAVAPEARRGHLIPGTVVRDVCELPCCCLELNSALLEDHPVPLTSEPSLKPPFDYLNFLFLLRHSFSV